jgi:hypothetical protein
MSETTSKLLSNLHQAIFQLEERMADEVQREEEDLHYHSDADYAEACSKVGCAGIDPVVATREILMDALVFDLLREYPDGTVGKLLIL